MLADLMTSNSGTDFVSKQEMLIQVQHLCSALDDGTLLTR